MHKYAIAIYDGNNGELDLTTVEADNELAAALKQLSRLGIEFDDDPADAEDWQSMADICNDQDVQIDFLLIG